MYRFRIIIFVFSIVLVSCQNEKSTKSVKKDTKYDKLIKRALINGYFERVTDKISVLVYQNDLYLFSEEEKGFSNNKFMFHLIKEDLSFINMDFSKSEAKIKDSVLSLFNEFEILRRSFNPKDGKSIRIGQFIKENGGNKNLWVRKVDMKEIENRKGNYNNELDKIIGLNVLHDDFENTLRTKPFFKSKEGFYVLLSDNFLYLIASGESSIKDKIMMHFIREDNTFSNHSFYFEENRYQDRLSNPYHTLKIAKVRIPIEDNPFIKIRLGQFDNSGNKWVEVISIKEIWENELLRYANDFEKPEANQNNK